MKAFPLHETKMRKSSPCEEQSTHTHTNLSAGSQGTHHACELATSCTRTSLLRLLLAGVNPREVYSGLQSSAKSRIGVALLHCTWRMKTKAMIFFNTLGAESTYRWWLSWDEGSFVRALSSKNYFSPLRKHTQSNALNCSRPRSHELAVLHLVSRRIPKATALSHKHTPPADSFHTQVGAS